MNLEDKVIQIRKNYYFQRQTVLIFVVTLHPTHVSCGSKTTG